MAVLLGVEAALLAAGAVLLVVELTRGGSGSPGASAFMAVCAAGIAVLLVAAARALLRRHRWGRAPVATWQILQGVVAVGLLPGGPGAGAVGVLLALAVLGLLLAPPVVHWTTTTTAT